jgi:hypothetical protein
MASVANGAPRGTLTTTTVPLSLNPRTVVYGGSDEAPVRSSVVHSPWDHGTPAMSQQAARDEMLNNIEYRHAMAVAADAEQQRQANAAALVEQSEALRVRQQGERMSQRPPGESGEVLKGL